jgi:hypothetical protein
VILDSEEQKANMVKCIHATAVGLPRDASDAALANLAVLVTLRRDVESAVVAGEVVPPPPSPDA